MRIFSMSVDFQRKTRGTGRTNQESIWYIKNSKWSADTKLLKHFIFFTPGNLHLAAILE